MSNDRNYVSPQILANKNHEFQEYSPTFYKPHTLKSMALLLAILLLLSQSNFLETLAERFSMTDGGGED